MSAAKLQVDTNVEQVQASVGARLKATQEEIARSKETLRQRAVQVAQEEAPVRSGAFQKSIVAKGPVDETKISSEHPKAKYIIKGTNPSRGLYIKKIRKRLTPRSGRRDIGWHPGTPPHPVFRKAIKRLPPIVVELFRLIALALRRG